MSPCSCTATQVTFCGRAPELDEPCVQLEAGERDV